MLMDIGKDGHSEQVKKHLPIKKAFSVAEAMIALLIGSIALGMAAPMITKQIKQNNFNDTQMSITQTQIAELRQEINVLNETISELTNEQSKNNGVPSGLIAFFDTKTCPDGWSVVNSGYNGRFPRFAGKYTIFSYNSSTKKHNTSGTSKTLSVGATQEDTIRDITGTIAGERSDYTDFPNSGAFYQDPNWGNFLGWAATDWDNTKIHFKASRVVPTDIENRPKAIALLGCRKK